MVRDLVLCVGLFSIGTHWVVSTNHVSRYKTVITVCSCYKDVKTDIKLEYITAWAFLGSIIFNRLV